MAKSYNEEKFDSFLNKIIIFNSKAYFKKQMNICDKEKTIINDENYTDFLQFFTEMKDSLNCIETKFDVEAALKTLSEVEQTVLVLLFKEELSQQEAAEILEVYSKTVSKIKIRAIGKLKRVFYGGKKNEK